MDSLETLKSLVRRFDDNKSEYKKESYNEHSCRDEFINPFLELLGWDVSNKNGLPPQYREVIAEYHASSSDRPDYSLTLRGVAKFFVEAKKPHVDISKDSAPAVQTRKYGWNAKHKIAVLTNFEYFIIYDTTTVPNENDDCAVARYRSYHYTEYLDKFDEIKSLVSKETVYSGKFDEYFNETFGNADSQKQQVDVLFLSQINEWRIALSNELYAKGGQYTSLDVLNDVVQEFINQVVFLRICEDKNLPLYHHLKDTITEPETLHQKLEELFRDADKKYNSGMFSGEYIIFDLNSKVISDMIKSLYYPQSPYLFSIIEPNMLGKIYEMFLTEQLTVLSNGHIGLTQKKECLNRSVVTTPTEVVKYMVEKTLSRLCENKTPDEICNLHIADIACGSGVFLEEVFQYLQTCCIEWYLEHDKIHLIETGNGGYKLPLEEKKHILCSCIFGIDIDIHAVEVAKFSLLIKLIENETEPSVRSVIPILPDLSNNIFHGNTLVSNAELKDIPFTTEQLLEIVPFDWNGIPEFDAIVGNPPYVNIEDIKKFISVPEIEVYEKKYTTAFNRYDKYLIFIEQALKKVKENGYVCYIVPNRFFKVKSGKKLCKLISDKCWLVSLDDFGAVQLFEDKTIYSAVLMLQKKAQETFIYQSVKSVNDLWLGNFAGRIEMKSSELSVYPWKLTSDIEILNLIKKVTPVSEPLSHFADIFNGIQTSAERPPIYWFSGEEIRSEDADSITVEKDGRTYTIEKKILRPYYKPTKAAEKGMNTYSIPKTDKQIIFPYDADGELIPIDTMKSEYPGAYAYLLDCYEELKPKTLGGKRDVKKANSTNWYQYGRKQALTVFNDRVKLIVKVMAKEFPMYARDENNFLTASGDTAGYCGVAYKEGSPYALEYIQAWLNNSYTQRIISVIGSDFESGFVSRGKSVLDTLPFVQLDFSDSKQKCLYDRVVEASKQIYGINAKLDQHPPKQIKTTLERQKTALIQEIEELISSVYRLEF